MARRNAPRLDAPKDSRPPFGIGRGFGFRPRAAFQQAHIDATIRVEAAGALQISLRHLARISLAVLEAAAKGQSGHLFEIHLTSPVGRSLGRRLLCVHRPCVHQALAFRGGANDLAWMTGKDA